MPLSEARRWHARSFAVLGDRAAGDAEALAATLNDRREGSAIIVQADLLEVGTLEPMVNSVIDQTGNIATPTGDPDNMNSAGHIELERNRARQLEQKLIDTAWPYSARPAMPIAPSSLPTK